MSTLVILFGDHNQPRYSGTVQFTKTVPPLLTREAWEHLLAQETVDEGVRLPLGQLVEERAQQIAANLERADGQIRSVLHIQLQQRETSPISVYNWTLPLTVAKAALN